MGCRFLNDISSRGGKGGQVPFLGLPVTRTVASSPNFLIIFVTHASAPNGFPLTIDLLIPSSSSEKGVRYLFSVFLFFVVLILN